MHTEKLVETDMRLTPQRRAVLDVLRNSHDHPSAAEVLDRVRGSAPGIGAATVYRSLAHLVASGQALEIRFTGGVSRYDANLRHHDHLVCDGCGRAVDIPAGQPGATDLFADRIRDLAASTGFDVTSYDLRFRGRCANCRTPDVEGVS